MVIYYVFHFVCRRDVKATDFTMTKDRLCVYFKEHIKYNKKIIPVFIKLIGFKKQSVSKLLLTLLI